MKHLKMIATTLILLCFWGGSGFRPAPECDRWLKAVFFIKEASAAEKGLKAGMIHPKTGKKIKNWVSPMDPTYIRDEPGKSPMGMDLVPVYEEEVEEKEPSSVIRIDPVTIQNMGVRFAQVKQKPLVRNIRTYGTVTYDERRVKVVSAWIGGRIEELYVDFTGLEVKKGDPLAEIYSPELFSTQREFILALEARARIWALGNETALRSATDLVEATRQRLLLWGITKKQIDETERTRKVRERMTIHAPIGGTVIDKKAFEGQYVKEGERLYTIADLSVVWVLADVYEYELPWVRQGMPAEMGLSYVPGKIFRGKVLYIYPYLDNKTRTAKLRLEFDNSKHLLKPEMYVNIYFKSRLGEDGLVIPQEAMIDSGVRKVVFVSLGEGKFQPREVELGVEVNEGEFQVLDGLKEGEKIVVSAQFMLDSESRLREVIQKMIETSKKKSEPNRGHPLEPRKETKSHTAR